MTQIPHPTPHSSLNRRHAFEAAEVKLAPRTRKAALGLLTLGQRVVRALLAAIASLPRVEPYTGPASLREAPGERRQILHGRVVVTRRRQ